MPAYKKYPYCIDCNLNAAQIDLIVEGKVDKNGREDVNKKLIAMNSAPSKGQLISECLFLCLQISQKTNEIFSSISALASEMRSNKKDMGTFFI